ncbi:MAG: DUF4410 domain-containing protein [Deltaproteobacteria bacterium]|nr:DUF4410 domain-containing protein [Deltaproteobacteria bacterium]
MNFKRIALNLLVTGLLLGLATGCATTVPKAEFMLEIAPESKIAAKDEAQVKIDIGPDVTITDLEKARLAKKIEEKIVARKALNTMDGENKSYEIDLLLTRYDKGSAFARFMLAGLGQIHIDGEVKLVELPDRKQVGAFTVSKTFAWGGIYGGATSIEDIEQPFADGVAAALTGQTEEENK